MTTQIEMTGQEDRQGPWKIAIAGAPGSGKTLLASTFQNPLYVFWSEHPRIKSIATRHVHHVKLLNEYDIDGNLVRAAHEKFHGVLAYLGLVDHDYDAVVVDTGSEMFFSMKEARRARQHGEFQAGDWGWLADAYRDIVGALIDLPMTVVVNYWTKTTEIEEGVRVKELALQGAATEEAPGWFDVVAALDTYETVGEDGETQTRRVLLTSSSRLYPWIKDHSGALPRRFEISPDFTDDFKRIMDILTAEVEAAPHATIGEVPEVAQNGKSDGDQVPTPEELHVKKQGTSEPVGEKPSSDVEQTTRTSNNEPTKTEDLSDVSAEVPQETEGDPVLADPSIEPPTDSEAQGSDPLPGVEGTPSPDVSEPSTDEPPIPSVDTDGDGEQGEQVTPEEAMKNVEEGLDAEEVFTCEECGVVVEDDGMRDISMVRYRTYLCKEHFKERMVAAKT